MFLLGFDGGNFIQTKDDGDTWRRTVQLVSQWGGGVEAVYSPNNPDRIYVLLGQFSNFRGIGISDDGGATFTLAAGENDLPQIGNVDGGADGLAVLEANGTDIVLAVIGQQLWRSVDDGDSFGKVDLENVRDVAVTPGGIVVAATASDVLFSNDGGFEFTSAAGPAGITGLFTSASEPETVYAVAFRDGFGGAYHFDPDAGWSQIFDDQLAHGMAIDPINPSNLAIVTTEPAFHDVSRATGVHLSSDGGATWTIVNDGLPMIRLRTAEFDPHDPDRLVVGTTGRGFYEISFGLALGS